MPFGVQRIMLAVLGRRVMKTGQSGFTLVEIAIVLVIIGLLLGGILKGQELITSARVRNLADLTNGIQAAYFGFIDRYRRVPGDMDLTEAQNAIDDAIDTGGDANGRLDVVWDETNAAWQHLGAAGFIQGQYAGGTAVPPGDGSVAPLNPWNNPMLLGITPDFTDADTPPSARLQLVVGRGIPVQVVRELDVKLDDEDPATGVLRAAVSSPSIFSGTPAWGGMEDACISGTPVIYDVNADSQDCNAVYLF